jgi:hypothetical protein
VKNITYQKGQILEELAREFTPFNTYNNSWLIEFRRPDLTNKPVAQIYPKKKSN